MVKKTRVGNKKLGSVGLAETHVILFRVSGNTCNFIFALNKLFIIFGSEDSLSESDESETPVSSKTDTDTNVADGPRTVSPDILDASRLQGTLIKQTRGLTKIGEVGDFFTLVSTQSL
jgi:hypothetical protein